MPNPRISVEDLSRYVDAATDLMESVQSDVTHNEGIITDDTILAMSEFHAAALAIADVTNSLQATKVRLN